MLAGVKVVDKSAAETALRDEQRANKKEKKAKKKEKHAAKKHARRQGDAVRKEVSPTEGGVSPVADRVGRDTDDAQPPAAEAPSPMEAGGREDWMTTPMARPPGAAEAAPTGGRRGKADKALEAQEKAAIAAARELNPNYKGHGDSAAPAVDLAVVVARPAGVGDGGSSWRLKALRRAQTQAAQQGVALTDVVSERWGNVANLTAGITEQRAAHAKAHMAAAWERRTASSASGSRDSGGGDRGGGDRGAPSGYLRDLKSERPQMRRPAANSGFGSRKPSDATSRGASSSSNNRTGDSRDDGSRRSDANLGSRGSGGRGDEGRRKGHSSRQRGGHSRGDAAEALRGAAASINAFSDDGNFMDRFRQQPAAQQGRESRGGSLPREGHSPDSQSPEGQSPEGNIRVVRAEATEAAKSSRVAAIARGACGSESSAPAAAAGAIAAREAVADAAPGRAAVPLTGNLSVAAALRARLMGGKAPAASPSSADMPAGMSAGRGRGRVIDVLPSVDASGRAVEGAFGREAADVGARPPGRKATKVQRYDSEGKRERWAADDDATDLATLVKRQRYEGAEDMDAALADNIARKSGFKESDLNADDEYDFDTGIDMYQKRRGDQEQQAKRQRSAAIADSRRLSAALERCQLCISSHRRPRHLTLAIGEASYLMLPQKGNLADGHCCIVPADHVASARRCEGTVAIELRNFKKALLQMFMAKDLDVVFMETAVRLDDSRSHALIEAVPLPAEAFSKAPLYFKKAVDDAESEWSQHHAKRVIDTRAKGLQGSIPPNFPYFHVEFGLASGFVHVIDDEAGWDPAFGRSVLAGLLKLPANAGLANQRTEPEALQKGRAVAFLEGFREYDWTAEL